MLILSRKLYEKVRLELPDGRHIWVTVTDIDRGKVRLGIDAPRDIGIAREELLAADEAFAPTDGRAAK